MTATWRPRRPFFQFEAERIRKSWELCKYVNDETHHHRLQQQENILRQEGLWRGWQELGLHHFIWLTLTGILEPFSFFFNAKNMTRDKQIRFMSIHLECAGQMTPKRISPGSERVLAGVSGVEAAEERWECGQWIQTETQSCGTNINKSIMRTLCIVLLLRSLFATTELSPLLGKSNSDHIFTLLEGFSTL